MKTTSMKFFFRVILKRTNSFEHSSVVKQNSLPADYKTTIFNNSADKEHVDVDLTVNDALVPDSIPQSCEGVSPNFRPSKNTPKMKADFSKALLLYGTNCVVSDKLKLSLFLILRAKKLRLK
jgi:hypothetical protein